MPWRKSELLLLACFGVLITLHTAALVVLGVLGATAAQFYGQASLIVSWTSVLVSPGTAAPAPTISLRFFRPPRESHVQRDLLHNIL